MDEMLWKKLVWQIIDDYIKTRGHEYERSKMLLWDDGEHGSHFRFICDMAGYDVEFIQRRLRHIEGKNISGKLLINIGKYVMGEWAYKNLDNRKMK